MHFLNIAGLLLWVSVESISAAGTTCSGSFTPITAAAAFAALNPGWNLGNTLEAVPTEGSWNNRPVVPETFAAIKAAGFKSIRLPVTWSEHLNSSAPDYLIDPKWMARITQVVDEVIALQMPVIVNMHGDSYKWADLTATSDYTALEAQFTAQWSQIAKNFACHSNLLIFEPLNEPTGSTAAQGAEMNRLNEIFLNVINASGGFNPKRVVALSGLGMDSIKTSQWFKRPTVFPDQPWGIQFHYYSPYMFIFSAWGSTIWGSDADKAALENDFELFHGNFSDVPAFIGEWDASPSSTEPAARWKYWDYLIRTANKYKYSTLLWDNGIDNFNRTTSTFKDPTAASILFNAAMGINNSLADSTTDNQATVQHTSAFLFQKTGSKIVSHTIPFLLNGNSLTGISDSKGKKLSSSDYSMSTDGKLTFEATYLQPIYNNAEPGILETLNLTFSSGAFLTLPIVLYSTPEIPTTKFANSPSAALKIPITYRGLPYPATIKATYADGTYVDSPFTQYFGPLQRSRWTRNTDYTWDSSNIIIQATGGAEIKSGGREVMLSIEFFPRDGTGVGSNSVNVTLTQ